MNGTNWIRHSYCGNCRKGNQKKKPKVIQQIIPTNESAELIMLNDFYTSSQSATKCFLFIFEISCVLFRMFQKYYFDKVYEEMSISYIIRVCSKYIAKQIAIYLNEKHLNEIFQKKKNMLHCLLVG